MRFVAPLLFVLALTLPGAALAQRVNQLPAVNVPERPAPPQTNEAPPEERIVAVVNDSVISTSDVRARVALAILSSGLPDSMEVRRKLLPQVLRGLIDEQLQLQEGKRLDITVSSDEIQRAFEKLASDNQIPGGDMTAFLRSHGVPPSTLVEQVKAALAWNKVAQRTLRPRIDIGDDEIDAAAERIRANAGKQEYLVSEIVLSVDNPNEEDQVRKFAESLVQQIKGGAPFGAVARQFSQGSSAASGGDSGWIQAGQMAPELDKALQNMQQGEISEPLRSAGGFTILGVREKRTIAGGDAKEATVSLQQAFRPFTGAQDKESLLKDAEKLRQSVSSCDGLPSNLARDFPLWRWQDLGEVKLAAAPPWLNNKVRDIPVGRASEAMATDKGALILFVCNRTMPDTSINRDEIMNAIGTERLDLLARRLLRDLRRDAYIDVRLKTS